MSLASWTARRLLYTDKQGKGWPPGGGRAVHWRQPDDTTLGLIAHGDAFDIYIGRNQIYNLTLTPKTALRLALWVLHWWAVVTWFGIKPRLWNWAMNRLVSEQPHEKQTPPESLGRAIRGD